MEDIPFYRKKWMKAMKAKNNIYIIWVKKKLWWLLKIEKMA